MSEENSKTCSFNVCSQCKLMCCIDAKPPLTKKREKILTDYLRRQGVSTEGVFVHEAYTHPDVDAEGYCVLFNRETGKCRVHPVKPETCVAGPVTFDVNLKTRKLELYLKKDEVCLLAKCLREDPARFQEHLEAAKTELVRLVSELDPAELKAILAIDEPYTYKICEVDFSNEIF